MLSKLKEYDQDFEWYPTTREILNIVSYDIKGLSCRDKTFSILDVGAGNGSALEILEEITSGRTKQELQIYKDNPKSCDIYFDIYLKMYAIEKSQLLVSSMREDIFVIGSNFHDQTFIDKDIDIIFCNPPYSEYEIWTDRIIREANSYVIYMVIPERWKNCESIKGSIEKRQGEYDILGSFTFENSEFRKARAKVEIVKITLGSMSFYGRNKSDPFSIWFDDNFILKSDKLKEVKENKRDKLSGLVKKDLIPNLVIFYNEDFEHLLNNYKAVESLDPVLLKELEISLDGLKESLKIKIKGLKNEYWKQLFNRLDSITSRLCSKKRAIMLDKLTSHTSIDFTMDNIYSVVIWAIKNANQYFDKQLLTLYDDLTSKDNVSLYKSNKHMLEDGWRYENNWEFKKNAHHYKLDYRIIHHHYNAINSGYGSPGGLNESAHDTIGDICTIAKNLGYFVKNDSKEREWKAGKKQEFFIGVDIFMEVKAFYNGNMHFKINQEFMKRFNVEAGRLKEWIKSPKEAMDEMGYSKEVEKYFNSNFKMDKSIKMLEA